MKKLLAVILALTMLLVLTACGGGGTNANAIVGTWKLVDAEAETEYGLGVEFTKEGTLRYGITEEMISGLTNGEMDSKEWEEAVSGLEMLMKIEYEVKSDTVMKITASALFGLAKESDEVEYSLNGDTLVFDGATYERVKN